MGVLAFSERKYGVLPFTTTSGLEIHITPWLNANVARIRRRYILNLQHDITPNVSTGQHADQNPKLGEPIQQLNNRWGGKEFSDQRTCKPSHRL